nr:MAG TPA: hypothetical protein [Caudoviricetes sp.]
MCFIWAVAWLHLCAAPGCVSVVRQSPSGLPLFQEQSHPV